MRECEPQRKVNLYSLVTPKGVVKLSELMKPSIYNEAAGKCSCRSPRGKVGSAHLKRCVGRAKRPYYDEVRNLG